MMGILPDIARSLGVSIPEAGHLISAYALGVCFGAPLTVLVARTRPLKQILLVLTALIAVGNLCASLAPNYWMLMAMRFVSGLPHGAFFGVGSIVAERVADAGKRTEAVSIMIVGMTPSPTCSACRWVPISAMCCHGARPLRSSPYGEWWR